jgi:hypothetical protein
MSTSKFTGTVQRKLLNAGSKSEREATVLDTGDGGVFELRVKGGNPFHTPELEPFIGRRVSVEAYLSAPGSGTLQSALFIDKISDITVLGPPPKPPRWSQPRP